MKVDLIAREKYKKYIGLIGLEMQEMLKHQDSQGR